MVVRSARGRYRHGRRCADRHEPLRKTKALDRHDRRRRCTRLEEGSRPVARRGAGGGGYAPRAPSKPYWMRVGGRRQGSRSLRGRWVASPQHRPGAGRVRGGGAQSASLLSASQTSKEKKSPCALTRSRDWLPSYMLVVREKPAFFCEFCPSYCIYLASPKRARS